jgi:hypothetical protein
MIAAQQPINHGNIDNNNNNNNNDNDIVIAKW